MESMYSSLTQLEFLHGNPQVLGASAQFLCGGCGILCGRCVRLYDVGDLVHAFRHLF